MADDGSSTSPPKRGKAHHRHLSQSTVCLVEYVTARICLSNTQGFLHAKLFIFLYASPPLRNTPGKQQQLSISFSFMETLTQVLESM